MTIFDFSQNSFSWLNFSCPFSFVVLSNISTTLIPASAIAVIIIMLIHCVQALTHVSSHGKLHVLVATLGLLHPIVFMDSLSNYYSTCQKNLSEFARRVE